ncbi:MAG TPA: hypothetical protein VMS17_05285 [Gemmataceae bacterium]|nr:hypothetical protein [Gemmataceae bacterium]
MSLNADGLPRSLEEFRAWLLAKYPRDASTGEPPWLSRSASLVFDLVTEEVYEPLYQWGAQGAKKLFAEELARLANFGLIPTLADDASYGRAFSAIDEIMRGGRLRFADPGNKPGYTRQKFAGAAGPRCAIPPLQNVLESSWY